MDPIFLDDLRSIDDPWAFFIASPERAIDNFMLALKANDQQAVVRIIRGRRCSTKESLLQEWAAALQFPYYFGHGWDSFDECITDLDWLPGECYVFVVTDVEQILPDHPPDFDIFVDILANASREWRIPNRYNVGEPVAAFNVVFHAEANAADKAFARLQAAGVVPNVIELPS